MYTVSRSTVFETPIDAVWSVVRDFNGWPAWLEDIESSEIEDRRSADSVGCIRLLVAGGQKYVRDRLVGLEDNTHTIAYSLEQAFVDLPISDYRATVRLRPITDGNRTFAEWVGRFSADPTSGQDIADNLVAASYDTGFAGLRRHLDTTA